MNSNCICKSYEWLERFTAQHHPLCDKNPPPQTVDELTARMESIFGIGQEGNSALAVTGEPFVKLGIGGIIAEGEAFTLIATTEPAAVEYFWRGFLAYALEKTGGKVSGFTLYWRKKPEVITDAYMRESYQCFGGCTEGAHVDYCKSENRSMHHYPRARLLISDQPAREVTNE
jgi:hypothetical protein